MGVFTPELGLLINSVTPSFLLWVICIFLIAILLCIRRYGDAVTLLLSLSATTGSVFILKLLFATPRPEDALITLTSYAFPSGHAAAGMLLAVLCSWLLWEYRKKQHVSQHLYETSIIVLFALALLLGYSRILIGVHTTAQVLAGFAVGLLIPIAVIYLRSKK